MSCRICEKRKAERYCPAKSEKICAVCCGTGREVSIDCPSDCSFLLAAHRYEEQHPRAIPAETPLLDVRLSSDVIYAHQEVLSGLAFSAAKFCTTSPAVTDPDVLSALQALAETYKTLVSGIYYEKPPEAQLARELYAALSAFLNEMKQEAAAHARISPIRDSEIYQLLVFLYRMGLLRSNGRPRSRRFIEFLRGQFPRSEELRREESRIIVP